jgi:short-subunit dehydrogenase
LDSLNKDGLAVVIGSSGGIGAAMMTPCAKAAASPKL